MSARTYDLVVRAVIRHGDSDAVVLDRDDRTIAPGVYNLWLEDGGWVHLGEVVDERSATVTRVVQSVVPVGALRVGQRASWSGIYYRDPVDAGLTAKDVVVETTAGPAPAWLIRPQDGVGYRWAIHIHGLGSPRAGTLRGVKVASEAGLTSLVVTHRNDGEGPSVGSGRSTLGATETGDVAAAIRFALAHGAERVVLFGWSMGAAIALQLAVDDEFRDVIERLVLESPVLDWQSTINANCARAGSPSWFGVCARPWLRSRRLSRLMGLPAPIPLDRFDWIGRVDELEVLTLILHGRDDTSAPHAVSRLVANRRQGQVRLESFDADHTMTWNANAERWQGVVSEWSGVRTT